MRLSSGMQCNDLSTGSAHDKFVYTVPVNVSHGGLGNERRAAVPLRLDVTLCADNANLPLVRRRNQLIISCRQNLQVACSVDGKSCNRRRLPRRGVKLNELTAGPI